MYQRVCALCVQLSEGLTPVSAHCESAYVSEFACLCVAEPVAVLNSCIWQS